MCSEASRLCRVFCVDPLLLPQGGHQIVIMAQIEAGRVLPGVSLVLVIAS